MRACLGSDYRGWYAYIAELEDSAPFKYRIVLHDGRILLDAGSLDQAKLELRQRGIIEYD